KFLVFQLGRCRRFQRAVVPENIKRPPISLCRELETDGAAGRERIIIFDLMRDLAIKGTDMSGPGLDRKWCIQIKQDEHRPETVMAHVGKSAAAKFIPAAKNGMGVVGVVR